MLSTLTREDLGAAAPEAAARPLGRLDARTLRSDLTMEDAVVDDGRLLGLLCLKRHGNGLCTDAGVASRCTARHATRPAARWIRS